MNQAPVQRFVDEIDTSPHESLKASHDAGESVQTIMERHHKRSSIRKKIAVLGVLFFILAIGVAAFSMFFGNNIISAENISVDVSGPIAATGGGEYAFQVAIANQNSVPIQSASLIIEYPSGTKSATEEGKEVQVERRQLDAINTGELINVQVKARLYGEENDEKEIKVSIDYRVAGSGATFHKEASPLRLKISTSPVVIAFDTLKNITSGQELELSLIVQSNSPTPLSNVLIKASYPTGFNFTAAKPDATSGDDGWFIPTLAPGEKKTIVIRGLMTGHDADAQRFLASAGITSENDKNTLTSTLAKAQTEVVFEQSFLDVALAVNGSNADVGVIGPHEAATVEVQYNNTLDTTIYDGKVLVELGGNALNEFEVQVSGGYYDSSHNTITWDSAGVDTLKEILPGQSRVLSFSITPKDTVGKAPEMNVKVTVKGHRIFEGNVPQELVGTASRIIKVESVPVLTAVALYTQGPFTNIGPVPPVAEKETQYTLTLKMQSGANDMTGAEVTAIVPQYMKWLSTVSSGANVTYNAETRTMKWTIGDMSANSNTEMSVQVSYTPSVTQVGTTPTILEIPRFKATDRFTGTVVRAEHSALTTSLSAESDQKYQDGRVRAE
jgi:hypothetical protein